MFNGSISSVPRSEAGVLGFPVPVKILEIRGHGSAGEGVVVGAYPP
jgi:hypothetical protein